MLNLSSKGQVRYCRKADLPEPTQNAGWFLDTLKQKVWFFPLGADKWQSLDLKDYQPFETCGNILILSKFDGGQVYLCKDFYGQISSGDSIYCGKSVMTFFSKRDVQISGIPPQGTIAKRMLLPNAPIPLETVNGRQGYCLYSAYSYFSILEEVQIRTWGFIDRENGEWVIEPKFDAPFSFQNGVAEVVYYGQKFKINEKGERLD